MVADDGFFDWAFKGLVTVLLSIGAWLWIMLVKAVGKNRDDLAAHKLHVSETYARKTEISDVFDAIDEVRTDIKTLLQRHP